MSKNIKQAALFLLLIVSMLLAIQHGIDYAYRKRVCNKFTRLFAHTIDPQVMIFGSSVAYHQFIPRVIDSVTGNTTYNMGWPGMFFIQYSGLLKEYLSYEKNSRCIVIACDFDNLGRTELIRNPDLFYAYLGNDYVYNSLHAIEPQKIFQARYVPGYKLTVLNSAFYKNLFLAPRDNDSMNGFTPLNGNWEAANTSGSFLTRYDEHVFEQFRVAVNDIAARGIKVVLVIPPVYTEGMKLIANAGMIRSKYASLVKEHIYFLDYTSDTMCLNKGYFHNFTHLNEGGAVIFSHTFARDLLKIMHE